MNTRLALPAALATLLGMAAPAGAAEYWLRAEPLTLSMPGGASVPMWGYALCTDASPASCDPATVPGPALTVPVGDTQLTVHLRNDLPAGTSIVIPGQSATLTPVMFTDDSGRRRVRSFTHEAAAGGGSADYVWTALKPGSYLYHSGTQPQVQVQMGLYGSVTKDSAAGQAYPGLSYSRELTLLFSEIDPALHAAVSNGSYGPCPVASPGCGNMTSTLDYRPRYFLINGRPFQAGDPPLATLQPGQTALLRFLNAGLQTHVPVLNGLSMKLVAEDGNPLPWPAHPREQYSVLLPAAKTMDALVVAQAVPGATVRYALFDRTMDLSNDGAADGGMLAFLEVAAGGQAPSFSSTPITAATQGQPYSYTLAATDPNGDALRYSLDRLPAGMTVDSASGLIAWTPAANQVGSQAVTARVTDATGLFATQSFSIAVANVNDAPLAGNDSYAMVQGGTLSVAAPGVLANDSDPDAGDTLSATGFSAASNGSVNGQANGSFVYTPGASFTGTASFSYRAQDSAGAMSSPATVSITVSANRAPVAQNDSFSAPVQRKAVPYTPRVLTVLANDSDPDTALDPANVINPATVTVTTAPNKGGSVTVNANGTISYTPKLNFKGSELFSYRVRDSRNAQSNAATVRVNVQ